MRTTPSPMLAARYRLVRRLGRGGMGAVWLAHDELLHRDVALKRTHAESGGEELRQEARALARLHHPNIVSVYDIVEVDDETYLSLEFIEGESLAEALAERGPLGEEEARRIGVEIAEGLAYAHEQGVLHNDVKPGNILLDASGRAHLADFGIARLARTTVSVSAANEMLGTLQYVAPELLEGSPPSAASDVYALGVTVYECVAGAPPFVGSDGQSAAQRLVREPPPLRRLAPGASVRLEQVLARALKAEPAERYRSAAELGAALTAGTPTERVAPVAPAGAGSSHRGHDRPGKRVALGLFAAGASVLLVAGLAWSQGDRGSAPRTPSPTATGGASVAAVSASPTAVSPPVQTPLPAPNAAGPNPGQQGRGKEKNDDKHN